MPRLTEKQRDKLLADYHAGINKNQLSLKYEISPAAVSKICKGIAPKHIDKVNMLTHMALELRDAKLTEIDSINQQLNQKVADMEFFRSASLLVAKKAVDKVNSEDLSMYELEKAQVVIGKGKENIYGRVPDTAIQINNQQKEDIVSDRPQVDREEWLRLHGISND